MKPLRILLGNNTLSLLAGSESWTLTLAMQLRSMGHKVFCYAPELGVISDKLINQGIPCFKEIGIEGPKPFSIVLEEKEEHEYDVIIANHFHVVDYLRSQFPKTPIISTIHGVIHEMEEEQGSKLKAPEHPALESGVNQFVSVSEEVQQKLKQEYSIDSVIIRNFFDIKRLSSLKPAAEKPKQFLINTNYNSIDDELIQTVRDVANHFGARLSAIGMNFTQAVDITRAIEDSDIVFGMGRSVLEGVAAGRLGIVHGRWGTGGVINESSVKSLRSCNFSGRDSDGKLATKEEMIKMIEQHYDPAILQWGKEYMAKEHNAAFAAEEYVRLARELRGELIFKPQQIAQAVHPDAKPFRLAKNA